MVGLDNYQLSKQGVASSVLARGPAVHVSLKGTYLFQKSKKSGVMAGDF